MIGASLGMKASEWGEDLELYFDKDDDFDDYIETNRMSDEEVEDLLERSRLRREMSDLIVDNDYISSIDMDGDLIDYDEEEDIFEPIVNSITIGGDEVPITKDTKDLKEIQTPQIISEDFYFNDTEYVNYVKETLTYFEDDDTLIDEKEQVIYDVENVIGTEALNSFGHMSNDKDTVFVINHRLGIKYEVIRDPGKYTEIVLGIPDEEPDYTKAKKFFKDLEEREE